MYEYETLEEYFADHPDEEQGYIDDMAEFAEQEGILEYPEDWTMEENPYGECR